MNRVHIHQLGRWEMMMMMMVMALINVGGATLARVRGQLHLYQAEGPVDTVQISWRAQKGKCDR